MSNQRIDHERAGWVWSSKRPTGPNGRPLCRWCEQEIPKGSRRRTFCSENCVTEHRLRTDPTFVRHKVYERDRGVCAACGLDTKAIDRETKDLASQDPQPVGALGRARRIVLARYGIPEHRRTYWDADHIVSVVEGGGLTGIDNYQTLCVACHKRKTAELARRRAEQRRDAKERGLGRVRLPLEVTA